MIRKVEWNNLPALEIEAGGYSALLVPSVGANLVKLTNTALGIDILRTPKPEDMETFKSRPQIFGLPLLFPPNRIEDGRYSYNGRNYQYPITLPDQNNYHHGIIKSAPFVVTKCDECDGWARVEASFFSNCFNDSIYCDFPHNFVCTMRFTLSNEGLEQTVSFKNLDCDGEMPLGVGFHTPINIPFAKDSTREDYTIQASIGKRWVLSDRNLPTGELVELTADEQAMRGKGMMPFVKLMDDSFTAEPIEVDGNKYHGAIITDSRSGHKVYYEVDDKMKHWVLWNNGANVPWFCPEPQTWAINTPNLKLPAEVTGFASVAAGDTWSSTSKIYVK